MGNYLLSIFKLDRSVLFYVFAWSMIGFVHLGINAVLVNLYIVKLGFDLGFVGLLNGSGQIIWALSAFPAGMIGARFGLRDCLIAGFAAVSIGLACFLSVAWLPPSAWETGLLLSNAITWMGAALVVVNGTPYLMAIAPDKDRNKAFTLSSALIALAAFLGSITAGILPGLLMNRASGGWSEASAYNAEMWLAIPAYLASAFILLKAQREPLIVKETANTLREAAPVGTLVFLGILFWMQIGSENALAMFLNVYFAEHLLVSSALIGTIFAVGRLLPFFISPLQPLALNRWGSGRTMTAGYLLIAGCAALIAFVPNGIIAAIGFILFNLITSFTATARTIFGQEAVQPRWRTAVTAVFTVSMATGGSLVGFGAGRMIDSAGYRGLFISSAVMALIVVILYILQRRLTSRQVIPVQSEILVNKS